MHKNVIAITVTLLQQCIPENTDDLSFAVLQEQIMVSAKKAVGRGSDPFWMTTSKKDRRYCVLVTALGHIRETRGSGISEWIVRALKNWNKLDILPEILEECLDQSILPLVANWEKVDAETAE
jgi:hypothetical protein